jgi:mono/diheme cytochrome c family protein
VRGAGTKRVSFSGGTTGGWYAYAINAQSPAPIPWDAESLVWYLRHGWHDLHGVSRGPMAPVTANLGAAPEEDVRAIATYVASLMGEATPERREKAALLLAQISGSLPQRLPASSDSQLAPVLESPDDRAGAAIYASACATCHEAGRRLPYGGLHLALSTGVHGPDPQNVINVVLAGLPPAQGERSPLMPGFAGAISEEQLIALLEYLRERFTDKPRWENVGELVRETLSGERTFVVRASDGDQFSPAAN